MLQNDLSKILGFYEPGVLHLKVNTDEDISNLNDLIKNKPNLFSTFFHEYIHFLQNITTTAGLYQTSFYINYIKDLNRTVLEDSSLTFKTPVKVSDQYYSNTNIQLLNLYSGDKTVEEYIKYDSYKEEPIEFTDNDGKKFHPWKCKIYYYDKHGSYRNFHFGTTCLKEYVAHTIQSDYLQSTVHPVVPYQVAELIVQQEYPEVGNDKKLMIALCDISLMAYDPARQFFAIIKLLQQQNFVPVDALALIEFVKANLNFGSKENQITQDELFEKTYNDTINHLNNALKSKIFSNELNWLKHILSNAKTIRLENPDFMNQLVEKPRELSTFFSQLFKILGSPFYSNTNFEGGYVPPRDTLFAEQPYMLLVFKQIINVYNGGKKCLLYEFCQKSNETITNEHCITAPWRRVELEEKCPFVQFWITWGLSDCIPEEVVM